MYRPGQLQQQARQLSQESGQQGAELGQAIGALPFPTEARIDATGEVVTLIQTTELKNWPGHSPSSIGVDRMGKLFIAAFDEVTITDSRVLPNEQVEQLRSRVRQNVGQPQVTSR